ncbi:MAG: methyltransferase [Myxococcales bacterium]|nr:methyltransferase [Myxococcales bacterium]
MEPREGETLDVLSNTLRLFQRRRGHRATSDDVLLAGLAVAAAPAARRIADLGTGKGTVALLLARALPAANVVGVEAFPESHALAVRNAALNDLTDRFLPLLGDLRDADVLAGRGEFDLVCGAPPFMPIGSGTLPADAQRASGRFELRGGVEGYAAAAARVLAPGGRVVLLMDGHGADRLEAAFAAEGLALHRRISVVPRPGRPATFEVGVGGREAAPLVREVLAMRPATGDAWAPAYAALRRRLDLPGA